MQTNYGFCQMPFKIMYEKLISLHRSSSFLLKVKIVCFFNGNTYAKNSSSFKCYRSLVFFTYGISAIITNQSSYTRFSQSGEGYLDGFEDGLPGQYRLNQYNFETAFMYRGFSSQSEWHHKSIQDKMNADQLTELRGYYAQAGYFFNGIFDWFPKHLEIAGRHSVYRPDKNLRENLQTESTN